MGEKMFERNVFWLAAIFVNIGLCHATFYNYMCPSHWNTTATNCLEAFNKTDYCSARSICTFFSSKISTNETALSSGVNSEFWLLDSNQESSVQNKTCDNNNGLSNSCLLLAQNKQTISQSCNSSKNYICEKGISTGPLGLQNGNIDDSQLSSSSFFRSMTEPIGYHAKFARFGNSYTPGKSTQGGWCSNSTAATEYLQIDFRRTVLLIKIAVQGVKGRGCDFWTTDFNLTYRGSSDAWTSYLGNNTNTNGSISGNINADDTRIVALQPIFATQVRIHPTAYASSCINVAGRFCIRIEAYGIDASTSMVFKLKDNIRNKRNVEKYNQTKTYSSYYQNEENFWPIGNYSLSKPKSGCPSPLDVAWSHGYRLQNYMTNSGESNTSQTTQNHLKNAISPTYFVEEFCSSVSPENQLSLGGGKYSSKGGTFPEGSYCIYKYGDTCPQGFQIGSLKFFEEKDTAKRTWSHYSGKTPKITYNYNQADINCCYTEVNYCCRDDGASIYLSLPAGMPFYVLPISNSCPNTTDASVSMEYLDLPFGSGQRVLSDVASGLHPFVGLTVKQNGTMKYTFLQYHLCYYEPLATAVNRFIMIWNEDIVDANYELGIKLALFSGKNVIKYGADSNLKVQLTAIANCSVVPTQAYFNLTNGQTIYNAGISIGPGCGNQTNVTLSFSAVTNSGKQINISKPITLVSKTNVFVFIRKDNFNRMPNLNSEIQSIIRQQTKVETRLNVNLTILVYEQASDIRNLFRALRKKAKSDPAYVHGIVAINTPEIHDILNSVANIINVPFITGNSKPENLHIRPENSLQFTIKVNDTYSKLLKEFQYRNISEIVLIRSSKQRIPITFAYYIMTYNIKIQKDIVLAKDASYESVKTEISYLKSRKFVVYFIVDTSVAKTLLIAATKLGVSPVDGYSWISGSANVVYEGAVGTKECYRLKPRTCSEAFRGTMMFEAVAYTPRNAAYIDGSGGSMNHSSLQNLTSEIQVKLLRNMILDGVDSILKGIADLKRANASMNAKKVTEALAQSSLKRLQNLHLVPSAKSINAKKAMDAPCALGWTSSNCSKARCAANQCQTTKGTCVANGVCECHPGQFGSSCYGNCADRCQRGVCNDGRYGDGTCEKCHWLYGGIYCDEAVVLKALIASCLGSLFVAVIGTCYVLRICRPRQHNMLDNEKDESNWILNWNSLTDLEKINIDKVVAARHLAEKIRYTEYYKTTLHGKNAFVKCMKKKPVKLSLDVRLEIRKIVQLDHINIEKVIAVCLGPPYVAICTELASMGSLYDTLNAENFDVSLEIKYTFMEDICRGMVFLHDKCGIAHGRLKSTNCLLHKGWRVKITDFGLSVIRKRVHDNFSLRSQYNGENGQKQNPQFADYNSLLWTAPEYLGSGISNIDQVENFHFGGDVYSFGILMAEILSRNSPYEEIKVMSTQHIIEAIAHLRQPLVDLEVIRPGTTKSKREMMMKSAAKILRPKVKDDVLPKDEPAKSILRLLMESAWSDDPGDRPPFLHIQNVLKIIVPLKGDQIAKRAFLLEKETEMLEKYIAHDTKMILKEREKIDDWFHRLLPPDISQQYITGENVEPRTYENVSVAAFQIVDFRNLVRKSQPNQLISLLDYLLKMFYATASNQHFNISEFGLLSGTNVIGNGPSAETQIERFVQFCLQILRISKTIVITYKPGLKLNIKAALHSGRAVGGLVLDYGKTPRYRIFGEAVNTAIELAKKSESNCLLITEESAQLLPRATKIRLVEATESFTKAFDGHRTYWVPSQY